MAKTKFNDIIIKEILLARENGLSLKDCAGICGINRKTLTRWINKGKKARSGKYHEFYLKWNLATSKFKYFHHKKISDSDDWRASRYLLEVTDPETYVVENKLKTINDTKLEIDQLNPFKDLHTYDKKIEDEEVKKLKDFFEEE